ncbi:MAG: transglutaminase family protein, partial [Candidatus Aminicenantaceae bacterium]
MEIFLFVRDQIRYEPTALILKSPQDVLWSRSGNAKEQALLLVELLREDGEEARYASGSLEDETARSLIQSMFPQIREFSYND